MKRNESVRFRIKIKQGAIFIIGILFCSSVSYSQTSDFSGVWIQDTVKSESFYKAFDVVYTIVQTPQTFKVKQVLSLKGSTEGVTNDYSYSLDGKVTTTKKEQGMEKNTAQWSADKKILNTKSTVTYGNQDVGFTEAYSLSGNGLVLTVIKSDIIPGALTVKQVFNKKK